MILDLFTPRSRFDPAEPMSRRERLFWAFHADNPQVYAAFCRRAEQIRARGIRHYSADALTHVVRFHTLLETNDPDFKLNNNHVSYYARLWLRDHRDAPRFFHTRILRNGGTDEDQEGI